MENYEIGQLNCDVVGKILRNRFGFLPERFHSHTCICISPQFANTHKVTQKEESTWEYQQLKILNFISNNKYTALCVKGNTEIRDLNWLGVPLVDNNHSKIKSYLGNVFSDPFLFRKQPSQEEIKLLIKSIAWEEESSTLLYSSINPFHGSDICKALEFKNYYLVFPLGDKPTLILLTDKLTFADINQKLLILL